MARASKSGYAPSSRLGQAKNRSNAGAWDIQQTPGPVTDMAQSLPFPPCRAAIRLLLMQDEQPEIFPVSAEGERAMKI
jgi:hypothetical protein